MQSILYLRRKSGIHGFLKLVDCANGDELLEFLQGEEIHFRTCRTLTNAFRRALGCQIESEGKPMELVIKNKLRRVEFLEIHPIKSGLSLASEWARIKANAEKISKLKPVKKGFQQNCHTLAFQALEAAEISAPREIYQREIERLTLEFS